jgi:hypothetical protein
VSPDAYGPCAPWPVAWPCELGASSPAATGIAVQAATEVLWALSGRQFGVCEVTLRPCREECWPTPWPETVQPWAGWSYPMPALVGGVWLNLVCGACPGTCSCGALSQVLLPAPVHHVVEVRLDGTPMATGSYRLDDARKLVRVDGGTWPWCQDLTAADDQPGAWAVTAAVGRELPEVARLAVGEVACQFLRGMRGEDCALPSNWTSLARQGVTLTRASPAEVREGGLLGLYWADLFVRSTNPHGLARRARAYDVDRIDSPRRTNTTQPAGP